MKQYIPILTYNMIDAEVKLKRVGKSFKDLIPFLTKMFISKDERPHILHTSSTTKTDDITSTCFN